MHKRRRYVSVITGAALAAAMLATPPAQTARADEPLPLGPTVVKTDAPPSGYSVTFRYDAPATATTVQILGDWWFATPPGWTPNFAPSEWHPGDFAATDWRIQQMTKGEDGIWEITVPLPAGSYRYVFLHNCTNAIGSGCPFFYDPANPWAIKQQDQYNGATGTVGQTRSTIFVPSNPLFPTYDNDYQAPTSPDKTGTLESVRYESPGATTPGNAGFKFMLVYTPAGYDPNRATPYPLLVLSHGGGDSSPAWFMQGVANYIVENAIQAGEVQPMVVIATDFNFIPGGNQGYANNLRNVVFPYMAANYNVSTSQADIAFAGFSAGGSRASTILLSNTDLVGYVGVWSAGGVNPNATQLARIKAELPGGIFLSCGDQDRTVVNCSINAHNSANNLRNQGVKNVFEMYMNGMHTWHVWRPELNYYIHNLAFRTTTTGLTVQTLPAGKSSNRRLIATATVDPVTTNVVQPSGLVDFYAGETYLGSAELEPGPDHDARTAIFRGAFPADLLAQSITAKYQGDTLFNGSESE